MPLIPSNYKAPSFLLSKHLETIYPVIARNISDVNFNRERLELNDGDFLDLDWIKKGNKKLLLLSHGLEGNTNSNYIKGMARAASNSGYDVLAWNYRGCSGESNRNLRFYHSGESIDLSLVIQYLQTKHQYDSLGLVGFSVGGNITLKYLGENSQSLPPIIKASVNFSVPCDLKAGAKNLEKWENKIYLNRFLQSLHKKIKLKKLQYPNQINTSNFNEIKNFITFDERYTAPIHGFLNADDYYTKCSSLHYIHKITIPTLLITALNDPFLAKECYPFEQAKENANFFFETPQNGGHCGFYKKNKNGNYWSDNRALDFFSNYL